MAMAKCVIPAIIAPETTPTVPNVEVCDCPGYCYGVPFKLCVCTIPSTSLPKRATFSCQPVLKAAIHAPESRPQSGFAHKLTSLHPHTLTPAQPHTLALTHPHFLSLSHTHTHLTPSHLYTLTHILTPTVHAPSLFTVSVPFCVRGRDTVGRTHSSKTSWHRTSLAL